MMPASQPTTTAKVPKFLRVLYDILHNERPDIIAWSPCGTFFQIHDTTQLEQDVLPRYFKHNKFASFQRQLNNFGFRKWTKTRASVCTFSHDTLVRCRPSELAMLVADGMIVSPHIKTVGGKRLRSDSGSSTYSNSSSSTNSSSSIGGDDYSDEDDNQTACKMLKTAANDIDDCLLPLSLLLLDGDCEDLDALLELSPDACESDDSQWGFYVDLELCGNQLDDICHHHDLLPLSIVSDASELVEEDWTTLMECLA